MFRSILLPIDLAAEASWKRPLEIALEAAKKTAGSGSGSATLHLLTVVPDFGMSIVGSYFQQGFEKKALDDTEAKLHEFAARHVPAGVPVEIHIAHGSIYDEILRCANKLGCDAIVLAAHRPELRDYLLGPNAARVVRHARQSVIVVRDA